MKRKTTCLDTACDEDVNTNVLTKINIEKTMDKRKKKKIKFEKSSNNHKDKDLKKLLSRREKNTKEINLKKAKQDSTAEKVDRFQLRKTRKVLKQTRKAKKLGNDKLYDVVISAKRINEKLRRSDCTPQDRAKLIATLHEKLRTLYSKIIFTHDMSRVIQCMIKYSEMDIRRDIFDEIKLSVVQMSQSKYAKNCLKSILKYGSREIRNEIISALCGNIVKLMSHTVSAPLVELLYSRWCTDLDKMYFKQEFYGDVYKQAKDKNVKTLLDVFETAKDMKSATLSAVKMNLVRILDKGLVDSTLLHTIIWEFLCLCSAADRSELIVMLRDFIVTLSRTRTGAKVAAQCVWHGNNKDKKVIMKVLKENVKTICTSEHGYMVLLALFDSADDTVIVRKMILTELQKDLTDIALDEYGKRVILYLVARRDSRYFPPSTVEYLRQGDNNSISKKPADIREKELLDAIGDPLLEAVTVDTVTWLSNSAISMVTLAILKIGSGKKLISAFESIAEFVSNVDSKIKQDDTECNAIEHPGLHMMLKKLIRNDKQLLERNETTFGETLITRLTTEILGKWIEFNRACFLLIILIENESEDVVHILLSKLKPLAENLESNKSRGASILLKKLKQPST